MAITKSKKEQLIDAYIEQLTKSRAIVFSDYRGTSVQKIQKLRGQMRDYDTSIMVVKNTLIKIALERADMPIPEEHLTGPTAVVFLPDDTAAAAKALFEAAREVDSFSVKGAILEEQVLDADAAKELRNGASRVRRGVPSFSPTVRIRVAVPV